MNWVKKIGSFFAGLFSARTAAAIQRGIEASAPYVGQALSVATAIAALTPNRTDDEIMAVAKRYAVPVAWGSAEDRGEVLRAVGLAALRKTFPQAPASDLNRALEVAVGAIKARA
jgi:hypothetical protein